MGTSIRQIVELIRPDSILHFLRQSTGELHIVVGVCMPQLALRERRRPVSSAHLSSLGTVSGMTIRHL